MITTLADAPEHHDTVWGLLRRGWPTFMWQAEPSAGVDLEAAMRAHPDHQLVMLRDAQVIATMQAVPADWDDLPDDGWDRAVREAPQTPGDAKLMVGLAVTVAPEHRGEGLSRQMLEEAIRRAGRRTLVIPVRPTSKPREMSLEDYLQQTREDGLSVDPWVRTHQRLGATLEGICTRAMTLTASPEAWRSWCGPADGNGVHAGLLAPVVNGVYVEPNIWIRHVRAPER